MTSGSGIMHEELPKRGSSGTVYGFQLWVNLPSVEKMSLPRYQEVNSEIIPAVKGEGVHVRVVAGTYNGVHGPVAKIAAQPVYMDVRLQAGATFELEVPPDHTALAYLFEGEAVFAADDDGGGEPVKAVRMVVLGSGELLRARSAAGSTSRFMLITGAPFGEAIVPYGPFVMNTEEEIRQALTELRNGSFIKHQPAG
jgi:hypothetical protein